MAKQRFRTLILVSLSLAGLACGNKETTGGANNANAAVSGGEALPPEADAKVDVAVDDDTKKLAEELKAQVKDYELPYQVKSKKENQRAFLYLAAQGDDPSVIAAGLDAMETSYDSNSVDEDYKKVIHERLTSTQNPVLDAAIRAAKHVTQGKAADAKTVDLLHKILSSHPNPVARYEVTRAFIFITDAAKVDKLIDALYDNLSSDKNFLVSGALFALSARPFYTHKKAEVRQKAIELFKHADPGVRGNAIYLAECLAEDKKKVGDSIAPLLADPHPYVKSRAAMALASLKHYDSIDKIVALSADKSPNTYAIDYTRLNGKQGRVNHDGSNYSRVDDTMIWAIRDFMPYGREGRFEPSKRGDESVDAWIAANTKAARAWVDANREKLK